MCKQFFPFFSQLGNPAFEVLDKLPDGLHQAVGGSDFPVQVADVRLDTPLFHLPDSSSLMDSRDNIKPLSGIRTQVHTLWAVIGFQIAVLDDLPFMPPDFAILLVVPIHRILLVAFPSAGRKFYSAHPEAKGKFTIYNIDGESYSGAYGYAVVQGAMKATKDVPAADIVAFMKDWIKNCVIFFAPYTLKYAKKSGRIPSAAAFVGEVMGLRPIMRIHDHAIVTETKVRGDKAIVPKILDLTVKEMIPQTPYCIVYGNDESVRDEMAQAMTKKVG